MAVAAGMGWLEGIETLLSPVPTWMDAPIFAGSVVVPDGGTALALERGVRFTVVQCSRESAGAMSGSEAEVRARASLTESVGAGPRSHTDDRGFPARAETELTAG